MKKRLDEDKQYPEETIGDLLLEHESVLERMVDRHGLQAGDILALTYMWITVHRPGAIETYVDDGSHPHFYYGPVKK